MDDNQPTIGQQREEPATIMVCDDEPRLAVLTAGLLEDHGFRTVTVTRGDEALAKLRRGVDVLLLDVNLGEGPSALDVLEGMAESGSAVRAVLTSGLPSEDIPATLIRHQQVAGYLSKPYTVDQLVAQMRSALRAPSPRQEPVPVSPRAASV